MSESWHNSERINKFLEDLNDSGISALLKKNSFREYSLKITLSTGEDLVVYHSPKKNTYKIDLRQVPSGFVLEKIKEIWHGDSASPGEGYHIYADGSFIGGKIGYGAVILKDNKPLARLSGPVKEAEGGGTRQVAGEIAAVRESIEWVLSKKVRQVTIHYDYEGLRCWAEGSWRAKLSLTSSYRDFIKTSGVKINWVKVDAHTGNRWNDEADKLAKKGASSASGIPLQPELF